MMIPAQNAAALRLSWLRKCVAMALLRRYLRHRAQRTALAHLRTLPDYLLRDIGLSKLDVLFADSVTLGRRAAERDGRAGCPKQTEADGG